MAKKKWTFSDIPGSEARLKPHAEEWIHNALSTAPYTEADRESICNSLRDLYRAAGKEPPKTVIFTPSTRQLTIGGPIAAGVKWLLADVERQHEFCGGPMSEEQMRTAISAAIAHCIDPKSSVVIDSATYSATDSATRDATRDATDSATRDATDRATYSATDSATSDATDSATLSATLSATDSATCFLILCTRHWYTEYNGGNEWSAWPAYLSFGRVIGRIDVDYSKWIHYERLAQCGPRYMHPDFVMVAERPTVLDGTARKEYRDGSAIVDGAWAYGEGDARVCSYTLVGERYLPLANGEINEAHADLWATLAQSAADEHAYAHAERQMLAWAGG